MTSGTLGALAEVDQATPHRMELLRGVDNNPRLRDKLTVPDGYQD